MKINELLHKQVEKEHYDFKKYIDKGRWNSFYHQIDEIISFLSEDNNSVLEVGVGSGVLREICKNILCFNYEAIDIDEELKPDHKGTVLEMPFADQRYDIVACFQVLEHLPYFNFEVALSELLRVARKGVIISLPNAKRVFHLHIPKILMHKLIEVPFSKIEEHQFNGEHYWEINKKGYEIRNICRKITEVSRMHNYELMNNYRVWGMPYHHFFILKKLEVTL